MRIETLTGHRRHEIEVSSDGRTVWVNGPTLLARFGPRGFEMTKRQSSYTADAVDKHDWDCFVRLVWQDYGVDVSDHCPEALR